MCQQIFDVSFVVTEYAFEGFRQIENVDMPLVAVAQNRSRVVLATDDDEATTLDVKHIVAVGTGHFVRRLGISQDEVGHCRGFYRPWGRHTVRLDEIVCCRSSSADGHIAGHGMG